MDTTRPTRIQLLLGIAIAVAVSTGLAAAQASTLVVGDATAPVDGQTTVPVSLEEAPNGLQRYNVTVRLDDPTVASMEAASAGDVEAFQERETGDDAVTFRAADLSEDVQPGATDVTLGTVAIRGADPGSTTLHATVHDLRNDDGEQVRPSVSAGTLTVESEGANLDSGGTVDELRRLGSRLPGPAVAWAVGAVLVAIGLVAGVARRL